MKFTLVYLLGKNRTIVYCLRIENNDTFQFTFLSQADGSCVSERDCMTNSVHDPLVM
jgi:hypothetical protein